ncbi:unnamed protein product [Rhizophagus irregularis]|nr:unnamed protein product [Rhizophagus irregularis]
MAPKRKSKIVLVNATSKIAEGSKQSISKNRSSLNTIEVRSKKDKSVEEMSSDSENVAEEIEQELTITKRSLPNTEEARFKKDNFVLVVLPELETVTEGSEQEQSMLRKRSLPNPVEIFRNETNSLFKRKENLHFFNEIINENIPALIPDHPSIRNNLESYTEFEIAKFIADHPSILELANILKESKSVTAGNSGNCKIASFFFSGMKEKGINNKLLIEKLKLLFLKCRKPNSHVFNAIICEIYPDLKDKLHQETAKNIHHECVLKMADYRHLLIGDLC